MYADPRHMKPRDKQKAMSQLPSILQVSSGVVHEQLSRDKYFVWLARKLSPQIVENIKALKIGGLGFVKESKRYYPDQVLAAHVIGFSGMDNAGLEGLEMYYDRYLKGTAGWSQMVRDAKQRPLLLETGFIPAKDGKSLVLTIDETIQFIAENALDKAFEKHNAKGASIIVLNPKTGEILALANRPTFNLSSPGSSSPDSRRNRALSDMYEPGSVFKIVTAAAALEEGKVSETDKFFCEHGSYRVANHILHDHGSHGTLTFVEVIEQSSNIGTTKVAQLLGPGTIYKYAKAFRFGSLTGIRFPGEVSGRLKPTSQWSKTSIGAVPIGQEVTVTALQLACAIAAIANDGVYMQPFVVKSIQDQNGEVIEEFKPRVVSEVITKETAGRLKRILTGVVDRGTGKMAQIKGVTVAGKTGTAQKVVGGTYSHSAFYASFIGFAPVEDPQIAMVVVFDDPKGTYYGGTVAAPVFKEVAENALKYLNSNGPVLAKNTDVKNNR